MNCNIKLTLVILCFCLLSCSSFKEKYVEHYGMMAKTRINFHKQNDTKRHKIISECTQKWQYDNLTNKIQLKVLQFKKSYRFDMSSIPALLIGISENNDTLRILKLDYTDEIKINQIVTILPDTSVDIKNWQELFIVKRNLPVFLAKDKKEDQYFCEVKATYFGDIVK